MPNPFKFKSCQTPYHLYVFIQELSDTLSSVCVYSRVVRHPIICTCLFKSCQTPYHLYSCTNSHPDNISGRHSTRATSTPAYLKRLENHTGLVVNLCCVISCLVICKYTLSVSTVFSGVFAFTRLLR